MYKTVIFIETRRDEYGVSPLIDRTMTAGRLIETLSNFDEDTPVLLNNDNGYTYGIIDEDTITEEDVDIEEDEDYDEDEDFNEGEAYEVLQDEEDEGDEE